MPPPERWEAYRALGTVIPGTKFITFKVPLKKEICENLPQEESFSPEELLQIMKQAGKSLGLVVDLTFTRKYYNEKSFTGNDVQYEKIFTKGHDVPSDDVFHRFWDVVDDFTAKNTDEDILIGVHCTHGINRTGYLVCRYMIEKLKIDPEDAISSFGAARGHPIERENYIRDLKSRPRRSGGSIQGQQSRWQNRSEDSSEHEAGRPGQHAKHRQRMGHAPNGNRPQNNRRENFSHSGNRFSASAPSYQGQGRSERHLYGGYSSPLDRVEASPQAGWGSAADSGWGSSQRNRPQSYDRHSDWSSRGAQRRYCDPGHQYSWRRPDSSGSQNYRDRAEDLRDGSSRREGWNNPHRQFLNSQRGRANYGDNSRAERDGNRRHKGSSEDHHQGFARGRRAEGISVTGKVQRDRHGHSGSDWHS